MAFEATSSPAFCARFAPRKQLIQQPRQDRRRAPERAARRAGSGPRRGAGSAHVRQRIDVERADDARIQALEIEHPDVAVQPRCAARARARPAAPRARASRSSARVGATMPRFSSSLRYTKSNEAMLAATRSGVMPASWLRANASRTRSSFCTISIREPRIGARVQRERRQIVPIVVQDLADAIPHVALDRLAFAEHLARHRIERIVLHAHERAAQQIDAIEHHATGNASPARCRNSLPPCAGGSRRRRARD